MILQKRLKWTKEENSNIVKFQDTISESAEDFREHELSTKEAHNMSNHKNKTDNTQKNSKSSSNNCSGDESKKKLIKEKKPKLWSEKFLNPKCNKKYFVKDCEDTPDDLKKKLLDEFYEERKPKRAAKSVKSSILPEGVPNPTDKGTYQLVIEDKVNSTALGDCCADVNVMSSEIVDKVYKLDRKIAIQTMDTPEPFECALNNDGNDTQNLSFNAS